MEAPARESRRTTRHTMGVGSTSTCPICGLSFPTKRIAEHADRCAASAFIDDEPVSAVRDARPQGAAAQVRSEENTARPGPAA